MTTTLSAGRRAVLEALWLSDDPLTVSVIAAHVRKANPTIYYHLRWLEAEGLVERARGSYRVREESTLASHRLAGRSVIEQHPDLWAVTEQGAEAARG